MTKTVIHGSPREFDQNELDKRVELQTRLYKLGYESKEVVKGSLPIQFLMAVHEKLNAGYIIDDHAPITLLPLDNKVLMTLPEPVQQEAIEAIKVKVKDEYVAELHRERDQYKALLVQQLMEAEEEKEAKKLEAARLKKLQDFERQAEQCFGDVEVPKEAK